MSLEAGLAGRKRPVVAITGLEGRDNPYPGVAVARALRAARGDDVVLVGLAYDPTLTGNFRGDLFDRVYLTPYPSDPPTTVLRRLREIHAEFPLDAIIPALDSEMALYARYAEELAAIGIRTLLPPEASVKRRYKDRLESFCRSIGVHAPRTEVVADPASFFASSGMATPCYLKGPLADAVLVETPDDAPAAFWRLANAWGWPILAQEPVVGEEYDVCAVVDRTGSPRAMIAIKKIVVSRAGKGVAAAVVDDPEVFAVARRIIAALDWRGPLEVELVREASSGRFYLIEINARFPAWCGATPKLGPNLPALCLGLLLDEPVPPPERPEVGRVFVRTSKTVVGRIESLGALVATGRLVHR